MVGRYKNGYIRIVSTGGAKDNYVAGIRLGSKSAASIGDLEFRFTNLYVVWLLAVYTQGAIITISGYLILN